ncbi:MAG: DEAD/DEAH box helicase [Pseudobacteriovorax sp.]|nr:DEAD/DEAH box helicase [Pseudobacteriovorax sp.]
MNETSNDTSSENKTENESISTDLPEDHSPDQDASDETPGIPLIPEASEVPLVESFEDMELEQDVKDAIAKVGWTKPTPVQQKCLPHTLNGRDVAGFAQTGTGKTGVFLITIANEVVKLKTSNATPKGPLAIILVPTRELAVQIHSDAAPIFDQNGIKSVAVYGGVDYEKQAKVIKAGADVIVATPGRLKDYFQKKVFNVKSCLQFVCDEADRMFDMGFIDDVEFFLDKLSEETQKLLFSATTNEKVKELAFEYLEEPEYISVNPEVMTPERIEQHALACESTEKLAVLIGLIRQHKPTCSIIFTNTKLVAEWVHYKLVNNGIEADLITGDLPQRKRINLINRIKKGQVTALIATDVASRGLHISDISHVYNFDLPNEAANYVHRIGRTARAGAEGSAYSLVCEDYGHYLESIREYLGDAVTLEVTLPDDELLATEDKALNPYKDPDFIGTTQATKPAPARQDRQQDRKGGRKSGGQNRDRAGASGRDDARKGKGQRQRKGGQRKDQRDRNQQNRNRNQQDRKRHNNQRNRRPDNRQNRQKVAVPVQKPTTIMGMIKKFFSIFFGKK